MSKVHASYDYDTEPSIKTLCNLSAANKTIADLNNVTDPYFGITCKNCIKMMNKEADEQLADY